MENCPFCKYTAKTIAVISRHISYHHKNESFSKYMTELKGIQSGECPYCKEWVVRTYANNRICHNKSCRVKFSWDNDKTNRKEKTSLSATKRNKEGLFGGKGRPKGSKNKTQYPRNNLEEKMRRLRDFNIKNGIYIKTNSGESNEKRKATWRNKSDEELTRIIKSKTYKASHELDTKIMSPEEIKRTDECLSKVFNCHEIPKAI